MSVLAYWLTTFLWDFMTYQISMWAVIIVFKAAGIEELTGTVETTRATILLFFFHGIATSGLTYCLSFLYKSPSSAQNTMIFLNVSACHCSSVGWFVVTHALTAHCVKSEQCFAE